MVFVSVKDAKPKRKVAVPIGDNGSWEAFINQVKTKLKLSGIGEIFLASTGERIVRLDQLQDIDELYVVEVRAYERKHGKTSNLSKLKCRLKGWAYCFLLCRQLGTRLAAMAMQRSSLWDPTPSAWGWLMQR